MRQMITGFALVAAMLETGCAATVLDPLQGAGGGSGGAGGGPTNVVGHTEACRSLSVLEPFTRMPDISPSLSTARVLRLGVDQPALLHNVQTDVRAIALTRIDATTWPPSPLSDEILYESSSKHLAPTWFAVAQNGVDAFALAIDIPAAVLFADHVTDATPAFSTWPMPPDDGVGVVAASGDTLLLGLNRALARAVTGSVVETVTAAKGCKKNSGSIEDVIATDSGFLALVVDGFDTCSPPGHRHIGVLEIPSTGELAPVLHPTPVSAEARAHLVRRPGGAWLMSSTSSLKAYALDAHGVVQPTVTTVLGPVDNAFDFDDTATASGGLLAISGVSMETGEPTTVHLVQVDANGETVLDTTLSYLPTDAGRWYGSGQARIARAGLDFLVMLPFADAYTLESGVAVARLGCAD